MKPPEGLSKKERTLWTKLFSSFKPRNSVEIEMAKRYLVWLQLFEQERKIVDKDGAVVEAKNGVPYPSPSYSNMVKAEGEMRRLWKLLERSVGDSSGNAEDAGEYADL